MNFASTVFFTASRTMPSSRIALISSFALAGISVQLSSCGVKFNSDAPCRDFIGVWRAEFLGPLSGTGIMEVLPSLQDSSHRGLQMALANAYEPDGSPISTLNLNGVGHCEGYRFEAEFGASTGENEFFKILGGSMLGAIDKGAQLQAFGIWTAEIVHIETLAIRKIDGYWSAKFETSVNQVSPIPIVAEKAKLSN